MVDTPSGNDPTVNDTVSEAAPEIATGTRAVSYRLTGVLGKGGMGEVWAAEDDKLGREVALKRMRTTAPKKDELQRFLREAKIQARLDHPAILPVYELGTDAEGFPYFTMKKLVGTTLAQGLLDGKLSQQTMLRAFVDVCQAVGLAHDKGIVHRDLKPSNIMLGDRGEVYVLDWGVARVIDEREEMSLGGDGLIAVPSQTNTGQLLGTPGYMAPEQVRGQLVGPSADVYALGAILFEILAGQALHPKGAAALSSTIDTPHALPSHRAIVRTIPPELDHLCGEALSDAADRPSARKLAERVQQYLDGDRDGEQRRLLAAKLVVEGRHALDRGMRSDATRLAGRAIAVDPHNSDAAGLVITLVTTPPDSVAPEVENQVADHEAEAQQLRSRRSLFPMLMFFGITPFLPWLHVKDWVSLGAVYAAIVLLVGMAIVNWRVRRLPILVYLPANIAVCMVFSRLSGPFVLTPVLIVGIFLSATAHPWINERRWVAALATTAAFVLPFVLERAGLMAPSWTMTEEGVISIGTIFARPDASVLPVFFGNLAIIVLVCSYALSINRDRRLAQRALIVQRWHLSQLLPQSVR